MATPSLIYSTRLRLGWKQATLAAYLGVSRSSLSMAEAGARELPTPTYLRLLQLIELLPPPKAALPQLDAAAKEMVAQRLAREIKDKAWEVARLRKKINELQKQAECLTVQQALCKKVMEAPGFNERQKSEQTFWQQQQAGVGHQRVVEAHWALLRTTHAHTFSVAELQLLETLVDTAEGKSG